MSAASFPSPRTPHPTREQRRAAIRRHLLDDLDSLVRRHRGLSPHAPDEEGLHAEVIAAEVAHILSAARRDLQRTPRIAPTRVGRAAQPLRSSV
jgi:hypothetical protein